MAKGITFATAVAVSVLVLVGGVAGLSGWSFDVLLPYILPVGGGLALGLDTLSAFFLLIIAAGAIPSGVYAIGYTRHKQTQGAAMGAVFTVFIAAMVWGVLARHVLKFLVSWELMLLGAA